MLPEAESAFHVHLPSVTVRDPSIWDRVKNTNIDGMVGGTLAALAAGFFLTGGLATLAWPATLLGATRGYSRIMQQQLEAARSELRSNLVALLAQCRNVLCAADMKSGNPVAKVEAFIEDTQAKVKAALEEQFAGHKARLEEQERTLEEQAALTGQQRDAAITETRHRLERSTEIRTQLEGLVNELREMQAKLNQAEAEL